LPQPVTEGARLLSHRLLPHRLLPHFTASFFSFIFQRRTTASHFCYALLLRVFASRFRCALNNIVPENTFPSLFFIAFHVKKMRQIADCPICL